jgi:GNAT superfamily N-acetyltransferase
MPDQLVRLFALPDDHDLLVGLTRQAIVVRRVRLEEIPSLVTWVQKHFSEMWANEMQALIHTQPLPCVIAIQVTPVDNPTGYVYEDMPSEKLLGFAAYDVSARGMFGPTGVDEAWRGKGIGKALLLECLKDMLSQGYAYAVIGWSGPQEFYAKAVGAVVIENSEPGIYHRQLDV